MNVLGTEVLDLGQEDGPALLCSDLHVPIDGGAVVEHLRGFCAAAARFGAAAGGGRLFILGDLFDSYVTPKQLDVAAYREVATMLRAVVEAGCRLFVLHGNRDFLLGREFERATGGRVIAGGVQCRLGGRRALLLHGDELCQADRPYQRAKRWLRHPLTRCIARRLPLRTALRVAERARDKSRRVIAAGDQTRFLPTRQAVAAAFATGCELLVFGHIHRCARGRFGADGGEYRVLPAFDASGLGLLASGGRCDHAVVQGGVATVVELRDLGAPVFGDAAVGA